MNSLKIPENVTICVCSELLFTDDLHRLMASSGEFNICFSFRRLASDKIVGKRYQFYSISSLCEMYSIVSLFSVMKWMGSRKN